jgi:hypothetical protein
MENLKNKKSAVSLIFAIIAITALLIVVVGLNDTILKNLQRVGEMESSVQAQSAANSAFERALLYLSENCEAGCDIAETEVEIDGEVVYGTYEVAGKSAIGAGSDYYVPIPGRGSAGSDCDPDVIGDVNDDCNWNRIYYGQTVEIPLYVDGTSAFEGGVLDIKVRTPECEDGDDCGASGRRLIKCLDGVPATPTKNGCALADDKVVMTWQIWGDRVGGSNYVEGWEYDDCMGKRCPTDSEIYTTFINSVQSGDYIVINVGDFSAPSEESISDALSQFSDPVLHLAFIQTISNADGPIPYLEYQIVTAEPISNDRSFITAKGYAVDKGETYFWTKEGSWSQFVESAVNFVFQN